MVMDRGSASGGKHTVEDTDLCYKVVHLKFT